VLMRRSELSHAHGESNAPAWQADLYLEGTDQHRGWFQSSLLLSLAGHSVAPYQTVVTHGFMVDADREKISKSRQGQGAYEKPQTAEAYVKKYGADVVRLWVASQDFRNDIVVSDERINKVSESYRGIRNTLRYQLSNLYDFDPDKHRVPDADLTGLDRWILEAYGELERQVIAAYDQYEFHVVYQKISQFAAVELSAIYHDVVKDRLYTDPASSQRRRSTQTALYQLVHGLCQMLSPLLAFTADEAWEFIPGEKKDSVHLSLWQPGQIQAQSGSWKFLLQMRELLLPHLEIARQAKLIGKALDAKVTVVGDPQAEAIQAARDHREDLRELLNVSQLEIRLESGPGKGDPIKDVEVTHAEGEKCGRCWHWETDVGTESEHPSICGRCVAAVRERAA
jgi:isoleucyl-tRNA synthetase